VVTALNTVQPYDWTGFLRTHIYDLAPQTPENGITNGGYRMVYNDDEPEWLKHQDSSRATSFATSLGFSVTADGNLGAVWWDSLAFKAGITPDMQLQAVNDQKFSVATLREAILSSEKSKEPIKLLLKREDQFVTVTSGLPWRTKAPTLGESSGNAGSPRCDIRAVEVESAP